ncbi:PaREP1 family protein [Acidianus infernus]|uniref:PaREP1 family protein n=1 Tax=Acidianus infernus TaxID=12915 RepID=UPI0035939025
MSITISAEVYYEEAEELLSKGDLVQACEKYYKAAEEAIKLLVIENNLKEIIKETQENGWDSKTLNDAVTELSYKIGDDIIYMWASAVTLFTARKYLDKDLIEEYKKDVETLIEKAKQRFNIKVLE